MLALLLAVLRAVVRQDRTCAVERRFDVHGPAPEPMQVRQRVARIIELQLDAVEVVFQVKLAAVLVIAIDYRDGRLAALGQAEQQPLLDLGKLPAFDLVVIGAWVVAEREELVLSAEFERKERVNERQIVVNLANFEDLLSAE